jgi:hypothetical protein
LLNAFCCESRVVCIAREDDMLRHSVFLWKVDGLCQLTINYNHKIRGSAIPLQFTLAF